MTLGVMGEEYTSESTYEFEKFHTIYDNGAVSANGTSHGGYTDGFTSSFIGNNGNQIPDGASPLFGPCECGKACWASYPETGGEVTGTVQTAVQSSSSTSHSGCSPQDQACPPTYVNSGGGINYSYTCRTGPLSGTGLTEPLGANTTYTAMVFNGEAFVQTTITVPQPQAVVGYRSDESRSYEQYFGAKAIFSTSNSFLDVYYPLDNDSYRMETNFSTSSITLTGPIDAFWGSTTSNSGGTSFIYLGDFGVPYSVNLTAPCVPTTTSIPTSGLTSRVWTGQKTENFTSCSQTRTPPAWPPEDGGHVVTNLSRAASTNYTKHYFSSIGGSTPGSRIGAVTGDGFIATYNFSSWSGNFATQSLGWTTGSTSVAQTAIQRVTISTPTGIFSTGTQSVDGGYGLPVPGFGFGVVSAFRETWNSSMNGQITIAITSTSLVPVTNIIDSDMFFKIPSTTATNITATHWTTSTAPPTHKFLLNTTSGYHVEARLGGGTTSSSSVAFGPGAATEKHINASLAGSGISAFPVFTTINVPGVGYAYQSFSLVRGEQVITTTTCGDDEPAPPCCDSGGQTTHTIAGTKTWAVATTNIGSFCSPTFFSIEPRYFVYEHLYSITAQVPLLRLENSILPPEWTGTGPKSVLGVLASLGLQTIDPNGNSVGVSNSFGWRLGNYRQTTYQGASGSHSFGYGLFQLTTMLTTDYFENATALSSLSWATTTKTGTGAATQQTTEYFPTSPQTGLFIWKKDFSKINASSGIYREYIAYCGSESELIVKSGTGTATSGTTITVDMLTGGTYANGSSSKNYIATTLASMMVDLTSTTSWNQTVGGAFTSPPVRGSFHLHNAMLRNRPFGTPSNTTWTSGSISDARLWDGELSPNWYATSKAGTGFGGMGDFITTRTKSVPGFHSYLDFYDGGFHSMPNEPIEPQYSDYNTWQPARRYGRVNLTSVTDACPPPPPPPPS